MGYLITQCQPSRQGRIEICLDGKIRFWLYAKEARQLSLEDGMELSEEQYEHILHGIIGKRAVKRAMHLLEQQERTEQKLREKLVQCGYPKEAVEDAVSYVKQYHYLDDGRYARIYIRYHQKDRSRARLEQDLMRRGVSKDMIAQAMEEEFSSDGKTQIRRLLEKKHFSTDEADQNEVRRMYQFLLRRGFCRADIVSVLRDARDGWNS